MHDEMIDEGLQGIGVRFTDLTKAQPAKKKEPVQAGKDKPMDAAYQVMEPPTAMDRLKTAALGILTPALLSSFFWWCQVTQRMDAKTAVWALLVCVAVAAFRLGSAVSR